MVAAARALLSFVVPPRCGICAAACPPGATLCRGCDAGLRAARPWIEPGPRGIEIAVAAGLHRGTVRGLAQALKFGRRLALAERAAAAIAAATPEGLLCGSIVPVPPDPWRLRARGFDPVEEIALALAGTTGLPYVPCLWRERGRSQVGRPRPLRRGDPPRVRLCAPPPRRALLVDDVRTTGTTLAVCAGALRRGGCGEVAALTLAAVR